MELLWTLAMSYGAVEPARASEASLVAASRDSDPTAFAALVRLHERRVFRLAGRFFRRREDVEDAAQETFLTAWRKLATYKAKAPFEHWLTRVCLNCCYARLRRPSPTESLLDDTNVEGHSQDPGLALEVEGLLRRLAPADRFILLLLDGEGWSATEIADRLGWTATHVKVRAHRARKKLRRILEGTS